MTPPGLHRLSQIHGRVRGVLRCLSKNADSAWVVIMSTGNDGAKTKLLFDALRVGVCGNC